MKALNSVKESQGHPYTHTNHHHDMLSATQVKHEGGRKQAKKHQTNNKKVLAKVYDECVVASNQVLLVPDLEEVEDGEYSSSNTDSDDGSKAKYQISKDEKGCEVVLFGGSTRSCHVLHSI